MSTADEATVRRLYEQMCNGRHNELAGELFTSDHRMHDPQVPAAEGPADMVRTVATYQDGVEGHWQIEQIYSAGDAVIVRWTGSGRHTGDVNGVSATGRDIRVDAISIHRMAGGKIAETWEVWDTLGFLHQIGAIPQPV